MTTTERAEITPELLADLEAKARAVLYKRWSKRFDPIMGVLQVLPEGALDGEFIFAHDYPHCGVTEGDEANADFVVASCPSIALALVQRIRELEDQIAAMCEEACGPDPLSQAFNEGDGVYRP